MTLLYGFSINPPKLKDLKISRLEDLTLIKRYKDFKIIKLIFQSEICNLLILK